MKPGPASQLRTRILKYRRRLPPEVMRSLSASVSRTFLSSVFGRDLLRARPLTIGVYRALPEEIDPGEIARLLEAAGHTLAYPRMREDDTLEFAAFSSSGKFVEGKFGISEPPKTRAALAPDELGLIFVPGVVFGRRGERIGMGKGFYDRFLKQCPRVYKVALAGQFQLRNRVPQYPWDVSLDLVFTQRRGYLAPSASSRPPGVFK